MFNIMSKDTTYLSQLVNYINGNLKKGYTKESLKWALVGQGHSKLEIERAFKIVDEEMAKKAPVLRTKPKITYQVVEHPEDDADAEKKEPFWKKWFG